MTSKELKSILTENKITLTTMQKKSICIFYNFHSYSVRIILHKIVVVKDITATKLFPNNSNCWGIFADSQAAAKTLAVALGYNGPPKGIQGGYRHYHDEKHAIHIWYGSKLK